MNLDQYLSRPGSESMAAFAAGLGKNEGQMRQYRYHYDNRQSPPDLCIAMERLSGGLIQVEHERPDLPWLRVKDKAWPVAAGRPLLDLANASA